MNERNIVFFDGVCHLCNSFVDFLVQQDKHRIIFYAPLQGATAQDLLALENQSRLSSILYLRKGLVYQESEAVLMIFSDLGGVYKMVLILKIIPAFIRNRIYRWVAKNRYLWFGQRDFCRLPEKNERSQLLP